MMCCAWRRGAWAGLGWVAAVLGAGGEAAWGQETCQTATPVVIGTPLAGSNAAAADDPQFGLCTATGRDVWHTFTAAVSGVHTVALCGSGFDTVLALYDNCLNAPLVCDDDSCGLQSQVTLTLNAGQAYMVRVSSHTGMAGGTYRLTVTAPGATFPVNNACGTPIALVPNGVNVGTTAGATGTDASPSCGTLDRADVWFNHAPQASGLHIIELCSTAFDTVFSSKLSWTSLIQYDNVSEIMGVNLRLNWIPEAGRELFFVINHNLEDFDRDNRFRSQSADVVAKMSYTFRF